MKRKSNRLFALGNNWSLPTKISIAFLLAALIPSLAVLLYQLNVGSALLEDSAAEELSLLASSVADQLDQLYDDTEIVAQQISTDPVVADILTHPTDEAAQTAAEDRFWDFLDSNVDYEYVYLLDHTGDVVVSVQKEGLPSIKDINFKDREYFTEAMAGFSHIDALVGRSSGQLGFYFSSPVVDADGDILGAAVIKLKGGAITRIINTLDGNSGAVAAFLVDNDKVVVSPPSYASDWSLKGLVELSSAEVAAVEERFVMDDALEYVNIPELGEALEADYEFTEYFDENTQTAYIVGFQTTDNLNWVVGVSKSDDYFHAPMIDLAIQSSIAIGIMILIIVFLAFLLGRGIARPVLKLANVAADVENHKPFEPADIADVTSIGDEVGHLARVFSDMVLALRARMAELQTIYEIGNKISSSVELADTLSDVIDSLGKVIDFEAAEICLYEEKSKQLSLYVTQDDVFSDDETVEKPMYSPKGDYFPRLFTDRAALLVDNIDSYDKHTLTTPRSWDAFEPKAYLGVSLRERQRVIGTIELVSSQVGAFNDDNRRILESISIQAAVALSNAREVRERERRLMNMEIVVDRGRVDDALDAVTSRPFYQKLIGKVTKPRSE